MKRRASLRIKVIAVITAIFSIVSFEPANAVQFVTTMSTTCGATSAGTTWSAAIPFNVPETATITRIDLKASSGSLSGNYIVIKSDNAGTPTGTTLGTFNYSSNSGLVYSFTSTANLNGAGRYWLIFRQTGNVNMCFSTTPNSTGSPTGWTIGTTYTWVSYDSAVSYASRGDYMVFLFTLFGTGGGVVAPAATISLSSSSNVSYRQVSTITATLTTAGTDGLVTFYSNGKKIAGCINRPSSSLSATCNWKPTQKGSAVLTAKIVPTDSSFGVGVSSRLSVGVGARTNTR